ncbi:MAG: proton-conducting transporter membrane subunit [Thermanaerothrix sp.]|nr:proton-conducting transporter membrane subunit [Thermanaerothrix sp.]
MADYLVLSPLILPLFFAILTLFAWHRLVWQRALAVIGNALLLGCGLALLGLVERDGIQVVQVGNWPPPYGISLVVDRFSALMVTVAGGLALLIAVFSLGSMDEARLRFGFYPLFFVLLMGVCGAFITGDIFNLYVWFEVMLMASFVLIALGGERAQLEGALKYVILNLLSSALFLTATAVLYSLTGPLNMADLSIRLRTTIAPDLVTTVAVMYMVAFSIKAAVFPLFFWLPASYHTPPVTVTALFSGLLTKVGVYALVRVFTLLFLTDVTFTHTLLLVLGGLTMVTGVLGAAAQYDIRRLLSFHIISQIGYLLMGLGLFSRSSLAATLYFMVHVIIAKAMLFLVAEVMYRLGGTFDLRRLGGLYRAYPWLALGFLVPALSLAGIPPLSGFFGKLALVQAGLALGQGAIVGVSLGVSLLTLFSMTKIWQEAFWKPAESALRPLSGSWGQRFALIVPIVLMGLITIGLGLWAESLYAFALRAAAQLLDPGLYVAAVMGGVP